MVATKWYTKTDEQIKEEKAKLFDKLNELANNIVTNPEELKKYAETWHNGFHNYSLTNTLLILFQKPEASLCAGINKWNEKGRFINRGEHGLKIFAPIFKTESKDTPDEVKTLVGFRIVSVFDVSQTNGADIVLNDSADIVGTCDYTIEQLANCFDYPLTIGDNSIGDISRGHTDGVKIFVTKASNPLSMIGVYFHELGHAMREHAKSELSRDIRELEAEAISYIVCSYFGLDNKESKYYIGNWKGDKTKMERCGYHILQTAERIIRKIEKTLTE